jgi:hypothetical protein
MSTGRQYKVPESGIVVKSKEIWLSANLEGIDTLEKHCAELIYMTIDIKLPGDVWMTLAD